MSLSIQGKDKLSSQERHISTEPVRRLSVDEGSEPEKGIALCLSGGGYRAMVFHLGVLWRLNELGMLSKLDRISSVSGGSITAGVLGLNWSRLNFDSSGVAHDFQSAVVTPIRQMANVHVDIAAVAWGIALPFVSVSDRVVKAYRRHLFGKATLQDLPDSPRFVLNATNLQSGALMRFSKPYLADYRVGTVRNPDLPLAVVVAASSAFPPFLSPCKVDLRHEAWETLEGNDLTANEYRDEVHLSDGGVYDNLGLETAWKRYRTLFVSDAGGHMGAEDEPARDWGRHLLRVLHLMDNQVRSLRKRQIIEGFVSGAREGMYVGIRSDPANYDLPDALQADPDVITELAGVSTRLDALDSGQQERLVNWGYAICDTGLRAYVMPSSPPDTLPYPSSPISGKR